MTGALSRVGVTFTLAGAVVRAVGVLARMSEVRLLARASTRFWDAGTMTVASVSAVVRVHDTIAVRALTSLARAVYLLSVRCDAPVCFGACADASDFVECSAVATSVIDRSCLHQIIVPSGFVLGCRGMSVLALLCRTVVVVRVTSTPSNCIVTSQTTHFTKATVTADTLCVMLIEHVSHSWTHAELASVSVESDIARTTLRFVRCPAQHTVHLNKDA